MKYLHKFYNRANLPWIHLVWDNYYTNGVMPGQAKRGSFWWRDIIKLNDQYKGIASVIPGSGNTIMFWKDQWSGIVPMQVFPELYSFAKKPNLSVWKA